MDDKKEEEENVSDDEFNVSLAKMEEEIKPKIINILATISIFELLKNPIDSLCVEKPPVAIVVIAWLTLSKIDIPKIQ